MKFVTVYVNRLGKPAMTEQKSPVFPVGAVIVKEKLSSRDSKSPELMTVMVKREKGYNPDAGDWEYSVIDGAGKKVVEQGKIQQCISCHDESPARQSDHVFRQYYMSVKQAAALK